MRPTTYACLQPRIGPCADRMLVPVSLLFAGLKSVDCGLKVGRRAMGAWEAFLLGLMVAYTPSLAVAALLLHHASKADDSTL